jgi:hypothetical protein
MPAAGTKYNTGKRFQPLNQKNYKRFKEETNIEVDWKIYKQIILDSYREIMNVIIEDISGFKLPYNLGYLCVSLINFKTKSIAVDYYNSKKYKKQIPYTNLHSFGKRYCLKWFRFSEKFGESMYHYKMEFSREIKRSLAKLIKDGKDYNHWSNSDFWSISKLERSFGKFYKYD